MRPRAAILASMAVHGLIGLVLFAPHWVPMPKLPIEIEVLPYQRPKPPPTPTVVTTPPKPPPPSHSTPGTPKKGESAKPKAPPASPNAPPPTADLRAFAPSNVNLVLILRCDRLRESPHADFADALMAALPDYQTFLGGTGLAAVRDFDALLVASADPHLVAETFLAARGRAGTPLDKLVQKPLQPGDPRIVRMIHDGLAVLGKPEAMTINTDLGVSPETAWLGQLDKALDQKDAPALTVNINDLNQLVRLGNVPTPKMLDLAMTADAGPALRLVATFTSETDAQEFATAWPKLIADYKQSTRFLGIGGLFDGLVPRVEGMRLTIEGRLPPTSTKVAFTWIRSMLPPRAGALTPSTTIDAGRPAPNDGGAADLLTP